MKTKINLSFCTNNGNGVRARPPVLHYTFHLSSFTDRAISIRTFKSFFLIKKRKENETTERSGLNNSKTDNEMLC